MGESEYTSRRLLYMCLCLLDSKTEVVELASGVSPSRPSSERGKSPQAQPGKAADERRHGQGEETQKHLRQ
jgi:hypothetical protein